MPKIKLPENVSPATRQAVERAEGFPHHSDDEQNPYGYIEETGEVYGDDHHGWDVYLGVERVDTLPLLMQWLDEEGMSIEDFKKTSLYRANRYRDDLTFLSEL